MKQFLLEGKAMKERDAAHCYLKSELKFPDYYGGSLDSLFDCLGDICEETEITIVNCGEADKKLIQVFRESADENQLLKLKLEGK